MTQSLFYVKNADGLGMDQHGRFTDNIRAWRLFTDRIHAWRAACIYAGAIVARF